MLLNTKRKVKKYFWYVFRFKRKMKINATKLETKSKKELTVSKDFWYVFRFIRKVQINAIKNETKRKSELYFFRKTRPIEQL